MNRLIIPLIVFSYLMVMSCTNNTGSNAEKHIDTLAIEEQIEAAEYSIERCDSLTSDVDDSDDENIPSQKKLSEKEMNRILSKDRFNSMKKVKFSNKDGYTYKGDNQLTIIFPPNIFNCGANDVVDLHICQYTDKKSIAISNLSTTSDDRVIETNGMVYCEAYSNKKKLKIKKGKEFFLSFKESKHDDFKLFEGVESNGAVNWKNPKPMLKGEGRINKVPARRVIDRKRKMSFYVATYGSETEVEDIDEYIKFKKDTGSILGQLIDNYEISYKELIPASPSESIMIYFNLTKEGKLSFKEIESELSSDVNKQLISYFENMPELNGYVNPATGLKEELEVYFNVTPNIPLSDSLEADTLNTRLLSIIEARKNANEEKLRLKLEKQEKAELERINNEYKAIVQREKEEQERLEERRSFLKDLDKQITYSSNKLGWINCDRFINDPRPKAKLIIAGVDDYSSFQIKIVFKNINSVLNQSTSIINNIPVNEPINIILIGFKDNDVYFQSKSTTTTDVTNIELSALNIEANELKSYLTRYLN